MPSAGRLLQFPSRPTGRDEIEKISSAYLRALLEGERPNQDTILESPDTLLAIVAGLKKSMNVNPSLVASESVAFYRALGARDAFGAFDEKDYFLGETALLAGVAYRILGDRSASEVWLDRAEAGFRHTVNPSPLLSCISYQRLALRCEMGRFDEVAELAPLLARTFERLKMEHDQVKCLFLEAAALRQGGHPEEALPKFHAITEERFFDYPELRGLAYSNLADIHAENDDYDSATTCYENAIPLLSKAQMPAAVAHLKSVVGDVFEKRGKLGAAISAYQESIADYEALGMKTWVAHVRIFLANALLEAGRAREAEWQTLAALPTIDDEKMANEAVAAVALLAKSAQARHLDRLALKDVRNHLRSAR